MEELLKQIKEWVDKFDTDFEQLKTGVEKQLLKVEAAILRRVLADILPRLSTDGEFLKSSVSNMAKANLVDRVFDEVKADELQPAIKALTDALIEISGRNADYYLVTGQDAKKVAAIAEDVNLIRAIIGLDVSGNIAKGGYLDRLAQSDIVRERLKQFVLTSIATKQNVNAFTGGLKNLIKGSKDVDGALTGYWRQYAFDTYAKVREVNNDHFRQELGLKWFVYQGGLIQTSRDFCIKKNGKVFSDAEALRDWPKDPTLIDKKHLASYRPLIDRGRNNCRHFLMWISEEMANELKARQ